MSDYKEYRSKERITARVIERTIKVARTIDGSTGDVDYETINAGDYEVLADDGTVSYQSKAEFEAHNEPVRRERQAKTITATKVRKPKGEKADKAAGEKATAATPASN